MTCRKYRLFTWLALSNIYKYVSYPTDVEVSLWSENGRPEVSRHWSSRTTGRWILDLLSVCLSVWAMKRLSVMDPAQSPIQESHITCPPWRTPISDSVSIAFCVRWTIFSHQSFFQIIFSSLSSYNVVLIMRRVELNMT